MGARMRSMWGALAVALALTLLFLAYNAAKLTKGAVQDGNNAIAKPNGQSETGAGAGTVAYGALYGRESHRVRDGEELREQNVILESGERGEDRRKAQESDMRRLSEGVVGDRELEIGQWPRAGGGAAAGEGGQVGAQGQPQQTTEGRPRVTQPTQEIIGTNVTQPLREKERKRGGRGGVTAPRRATKAQATELNSVEDNPRISYLVAGNKKEVGRVEKRSEFVDGLRYEHRDVTCHTAVDREGRVRCLPGAVIAGFAKCGTAQLNVDLGQCHPQIVAAKGEPKFTADNAVHFSGLPVVTPDENVLLMEASPAGSQLSPRLLRSIYANLPTTKFVFLVRDPVERAYSHFRMQLRNGKLDAFLHDQGLEQCKRDTSLCLEQILVFSTLPQSRDWKRCFLRSYGPLPMPNIGPDGGVDMAAVTQAWTHCAREYPTAVWARGPLSGALIPSYMAAVQAYRDVFSDVLVLVSEEVLASEEHPGVVADLLEFLGMNPIADIAECFGAAGNIKADANRELEEELGINVTPISTRLRRLLQAMHRPDVEALQEMLGRKLPWDVGS